MNSNEPTPAEVEADKADDAEENRLTSRDADREDRLAVMRAANPAFALLPTEVVLDDDDASALRKLNDMQSSIQQYVHTVQQQGEQRLAQLQETGRKVWSKIAKRHNLDLDQVDYKLNDAGTALTPIRMKLGG